MRKAAAWSISTDGDTHSIHILLIEMFYDLLAGAHHKMVKSMVYADMLVLVLCNDVSSICGRTSQYSFTDLNILCFPTHPWLASKLLVFLIILLLPFLDRKPHNMKPFQTDLFNWWCSSGIPLGIFMDKGLFEVVNNIYVCYSLPIYLLQGMPGRHLHSVHSEL